MSTQEPAVLELVQRIVALGQGPLGTFQEVAAQLSLTAGAERLSPSFRRQAELGSAKLTLTMRNGTREPPLGNSGYFPREPMVESIELRGSGSLGLAHGEGASVVTTLPFDARGVVVRWPGYFYLSETQNAADQDSARWYLGSFLGRAPFDYSEQERRDAEAALIAISRELAKGQRDLQGPRRRHTL